MLSELNHSQRERLAFIDFCLEYFGQIARADLINRFQTGLASCSRDLSLYRELAPKNAILIHKTKHYIRTEHFKPLFEHNSESVLSSLARGFGDGISSCSEQSDRCFDAVRLVYPEPKIVSSIMRAIHAGKSISCQYESISSGLTERILVPHAITNNGHRWHIRAFDRTSNSFRDFVCTRFVKIVIHESKVASKEAKESDLEWKNILQLSLIAHPNLKHKRAIEMDYAMKNGQVKFEVREALAGYVLRQWNVDCSRDYSLNGNEYQLALANVQELSGVNSLKIAPGYEG